MKKKNDHRAMWNEGQVNTLLYAAACAACHCMHCSESKSCHRHCVIDEASALKSFLGLVNQTMHDSSLTSKPRALPMTNNESILELIYKIFYSSNGGGRASEHNLGSTSKMWLLLVESYKKAKGLELLFKLDRRQSQLVSHFEKRQLHYLFADLEQTFGDQQVMASPAAVEVETPCLKKEDAVMFPSSDRGAKRRSTTSIDELTQLSAPTTPLGDNEVTKFGAQHRHHQRQRPLVYDYHRSHAALSDDESMDEDTVSYNMSSPNSPAANHSMSELLVMPTSGLVNPTEMPISNNQLSEQLNVVSRQMAEQAYQFEHGLDELEQLVASDLKHTNKDLLLQQSRLGLCMDRIDSLYGEADRHQSRFGAIESSVEAVESTVEAMRQQYASSYSECQHAHQSFVPRHEFEALQQKLNEMTGEMNALRSMAKDAVLASTAWPDTEPINLDTYITYDHVTPQPIHGLTEDRVQQMIDHAVLTNQKTLSENRIQQMIDQAVFTNHKALNDRIKSSQEESHHLMLEWTKRELNLQSQRQLLDVQQVQAQVAAFTHNFNKREFDGIKVGDKIEPPATTQIPNIELYGVYKLQQDVEQLRSDTKNVHVLLERLLDFHQQHPPPKPRKRVR